MKEKLYNQVRLENLSLRNQEPNESNNKFEFYSSKRNVMISIRTLKEIKNIFGENIVGWMNHGGWYKSGW